ncbi:hypothetical protein SK128_003373 [Halocaridina rubra]|uniref:EGF-like domain-containing protein n=1 Tax=Halocaridina rubra TaxID=373956 RepID=A0AAN9A863_HALRR
MAACKPGGTFLTKRLSYTVSKNEMLMIELERRYNEVMWQKEPIQTIDSNWFPSSLVKSRLSIPAGELNGTGFYSIIEKTSERKPGQHKRHFGTVAVLIRECPDSMYGEDCKQWCPDCQYGGACHPKTGKCVCPPGRRGNLCEHACIDDTSRCVWSSIKSSRPSVNLTQICLPFPYGCSCAPGYSGSKCDKACNQKSWGVDCRYTCKHCKDEKCDSVTGECEDLEMTLPCAKYSLGLPRLRRKPEVKSIGETVADVHFSYWKEKDDDGEKPPNSKLEYTVIVWEIYPGTKHDKRGNTSPAFSKKTSTASVTATGLTPGTEYEAEVLVQMSIGDDTCVEDGSWRGGRIQHTKFQTECPERVPQPKYITASNVTNSSFIVSWEVWSPTLTKDRDRLERVQARATKLIHLSGGLDTRMDFRLWDCSH